MEDEYLLTNQLGGYCSSTFHSGNTRKYHGLLIVSNSNLQRKLIIGNLEEKIIDDNKDKLFSTVQFYPSELHPDREKYLKNFAIHSQTITLEYSIGDTQIFKEINLAQEANTVIVRYKIICKDKVTLVVAPLLTNRNIHGLNHYSDANVFSCNSYLNNATIKLSPAEDLTIKVLSFDPKNLLNVSYAIKCTHQVYKNIYYPIESDRGYDSIEDLVKTLEVSFTLQPGENFISMQFSYENTQELMPSKFNNALKLVYSMDYKKNEIHRVTLVDFREFLNKRYHGFLVDNNFHKSIIAGFPWFDDWGRDTFISFPGLLLATGEYKFARQTLTYWSNFIQNGLIPNSLENRSYNSLDASLWYVIAVYKYYLATKDLTLIKGLFPKIKEIVTALINGSSHTISLDPDGYLTWTDPKYNLSWMDSLVKGKSVTGRHGACIEIQMLWYNNLKIFLAFAEVLGEHDQYSEIEALAKRISQKFPKDFWSSATDFVVDYIADGKADISIRPNVVLGMTLPFKLFDKKKADTIFSKIQKDLVTDVGLLTLNKSSAQFVGRYGGTQEERDLAYHNGTIWPYLLGMYYLAILNYYPKDKTKVAEIKEGMTTFWKCIKDDKLNYLPELFSPDDLHPDGCLSQAWNYAAFLEVFQRLSNK